MKKIIILIIALILVNIGYSQTAKEYYESGSEKCTNKDYSAAIADFTKAIELNPKYADAYCFRGIAKTFLQDYRGSIIDFTKAIEIIPNFSEAYFCRGMAKIALNRKEDGCLDLRKAGELGDTGAYEYIKKYCQ